MTRPDDIPEDVWDAARHVMKEHFHVTSARNESQWVAHVFIGAHAIMTERERCAKIADEAAFDDHALAQATDFGRGSHSAAVNIASSIRSPNV